MCEHLLLCVLQNANAISLVALNCSCTCVLLTVSIRQCCLQLIICDVQLTCGCRFAGNELIGSIMRASSFTSAHWNQTDRLQHWHVGPGGTQANEWYHSLCNKESTAHESRITGLKNKTVHRTKGVKQYAHSSGHRKRQSALFIHIPRG